MVSSVEGGYTTWTFEKLQNIVSTALSNAKRKDVEKVYLASCYDDFPRMQQYATALEQTGKYKVVSRWIKGEHGLQHKPADVLAREDIEDLEECDIFIFFTDSGLNTSLGGKYVELGMVLERNDWKSFYHGKLVQIYLVGARTNPYTHLIPLQFGEFYKLLWHLQ